MSEDIDVLPLPAAVGYADEESPASDDMAERLSPAIPVIEEGDDISRVVTAANILPRWVTTLAGSLLLPIISTRSSLLTK
jgi:hypothetical protein